MGNRFFFWNDWKIGYRLLYFSGLMVFAALLVQYLYAYYVGDGAVIHWKVEGELDVVQVFLEEFRQHLFSFRTETDTYLLKESFSATGLALNYKAPFWYAISLTLGMLLLISTISDLGRIWYTVGIATFAFFVANLQLEILGVWSEYTDKALPALAIVAYLPLSFYFHSFNQKFPFWGRFLVYSAITALIFVFIQSESSAELPLFTTIHYGFAVPMVLTGVFCLVNAHEIMRGIVHLVTINNNPTSQNSLRHAMILMVIYIANGVYGIVLRRTDIDLDMYYLPPLLLFPISLVLGIWGFKAREVQYNNMMNFAPNGAFLYLALAIISLSSITFAFATGNDPLIEVYEDVIMYSHFGMGVAFLAYIYLNFADELSGNLQVYKVFFKPQVVVFWAAWSIGMFIVFGFFALSNFLQYKQAWAAYYNNLADVSWAQEDPFMAKQYYRTSLVYDRMNHRSNYALATLAKQEHNKIAHEIFLRDAVQKKPSPYAYAQLSEKYLKERKFFQAIFTLQEGLEKCPKSGELANNLGLIYNRTGIADSAFLYFDYGKKYSHRPELVESNLFGLLAKYEFPPEVSEGIYEQAENSQYIGNVSNQLTYLNMRQLDYSKGLDLELLGDSVLNTPELCYLYNYALQHKDDAGADLIQLLEDYGQFIGNGQFKEYLDFALAMICEQRGDYQKAYQYYKAVVDVGINNSVYANVFGVFLLKQNEFEAAAEQFKAAFYRGDKKALVNWAYSLTEARKTEKALEQWNEVLRIGAPEDKVMANEMLLLLHPDSLDSRNEKLQTNQFPDAFRYRYGHFQPSELSGNAFATLADGFSDARYKVVAHAERMEYLLEMGNLEGAKALFEQMKTLEVTEEVKPLFEFAWLSCQRAVSEKLTESWLGKVRLASFPHEQKGYKPYYEALWHWQQGDSLNAENSFLEARKLLPLNEAIFLSYAEFLENQSKGEDAYDLLLHAITLRPKSVPILQAYVRLSLKLYYFTQAEFVAERLEDFMEEEDYMAFRKEFDTLYKQQEAKMDNWEVEGI